MNRDHKTLEENRSGFIKTVKTGSSKISPSDRIALIRKGNELFNSGKYETAKKIFVTTGYSDGLIRMGDHYVRENNHVGALKMYWMAPARDQFEQITQQAAAVISKWLEEEEKVNG